MAQRSRALIEGAILHAGGVFRIRTQLGHFFLTLVLFSLDFFCFVTDFSFFQIFIKNQFTMMLYPIQNPPDIIGS